MAVHFKKALDIKLIRLVKENEVIYNSRHPKYSDCELKDPIWHKIGETLNRSPRLCKTRWVNIRDQMRKKLRERLRNPEQSVPQYKYEDELSFMVSTFRNLSRQIAEYPDFDTDSGMRSEIMYVTNPAFDDEEKPLASFRDSTSDIMQLSETQQSCNVMAQSCNMAQNLDPADPIDVFLMTIGSTLRKLNPYYLNQAKSKLFQVVQEYELQQMVNKDDLPGSSSNN